MGSYGHGVGLHQSLLDVLICPVDLADLHLSSDQTRLKCTRCKRGYPIDNGIPILLVDGGAIEPESR
jgi:uncharacterized protein YbaR (Trm112 family)